MPPVSVWFSSTYVKFRSDPGNDDTTDGQWCAQHKLQIDDLKDWKKSHPEALQRILDTRRAMYVDQLIEIDQGLLAKAKGGDARSIELAWRRFEGWSPKQADENSKRNPTNKTFAQLIEEAT